MENVLPGLQTHFILIVIYLMQTGFKSRSQNEIHTSPAVDFSLSK